MTHHFFWGIHETQGSFLPRLLTCLSVDRAAPLTPPPAEGRPLIDAEKLVGRNAKIFGRQNENELD